MATQRNALLEVLAVCLGVTLATLCIDAARAVPWLAQYVHLAVGAVFLVVAVQMSQRRPDGLRRFGLQLGGLLEPPSAATAAQTVPQTGALRDLLEALRDAWPSGRRALIAGGGLALAIFPPFVVAFWWWHGPAHPFTWQPPDDPASYLLAQLLVVGLPEEALFRGYVQGRLSEHFDDRRRILGVEISLAASLTQASLFALLHFAVDPNPARLSVFFPALAFTWLTARQGGIGAAIVFHALCNALSDLLVRGWL